jgi:cell division protein FtsI (penicillin-binding protein 3)
MPNRPRAAHRRSGLSRTSRRRLVGILAVFAAAFTLIAGKLVSIQGIGSRAYEQVSVEQSVRTITLPALRGSILASNGNELALSEMRDLVFADPREITDAGSEAATLAPLLHLSAATIARQMGEATTYVVLDPGVSQTLGDKVENLGLPGVGVNQDPVRYYPADGLAAAVVGGMNDNGPTSGLELGYNGVLTGHDGEVVESVDPSGRPVPGTVTRDVPAVNGDDVLTTIDEPLQYQAEQALAKAIETSHGTSGTAIVEQTHTGRLLAVANLVSNGRGAPATQSPEALAFTRVYEPGSVAKIVTISGALTDGVITDRSVLDIPSTLTINGTVFHDAESHPNERLSITGILAQSSNIGASEIAERMGPAALFHFEEAFGLTRATPIDFPGQSAGLITPLSQFNGTTLPTLAFGEDDAFTAVQMVSAVNTVANGGVYVPPRLVSAIVGPNGRDHPVAEPTPHRVVPATVASEVATMLEQVVSNGTGVAAQVPGYTVSGKTGTSDSLKPGGGYYLSYNTSSFAGFLPSQDPQLSILVVVDHTPFYGAQAAAPAFATIAHDAVVDLRIPSDGPQPRPSLSAVPVVNGRPQLSSMQPATPYEG